MKYNLKDKPDFLKCYNCQYQWESRSKRRYVKCPSCNKFFINPINLSIITRRKRYEEKL